MPYFAPFPARDERCFTTPPTSTTVLIVGAGPAGLFASYLLAKHSIPSVIVERHGLRLGQPKAHAINPRSLEIFRQAGLNTDELRRLGSSADDAFWVRFNTGLAGIDLGSLPYERQDDGVKELTPEPLFNIAQPLLEEYLQGVALGTGLVTIHRRWKWHDASLDNHGQSKSVVLNLDKDEEPLEITSDFVLGADGADSTVRARMEDVAWEGPGGLETKKNFYCSIHARGNIRPLVSKMGNLGELYFCVHPARRSGFIVYDLCSSWVHSRVINPEKEDVGAFTVEKCRELIDECIGPGTDYEVQSANLWYTWPRVATSYHSKELRIFLVGDAAHSFPPQGGLGINTGIGDVHNLVWKLSHHLKSVVPKSEHLLRSYTLERKPVATANALQSTTNEETWHQFMAHAGNMVTEAEKFEHGPDAFFRQEHIKVALKEAIDTNKPHFDSLGLQLGYVYGEGDGTQPPPDCWSYTPSARSGARLPHFWINSNRSILDLVSDNKFCLLHAGGPFAKASHVLAGSMVDIDIVDISTIGNIDHWIKLIGLDERLGLLVRPDQHILGRAVSDDDVARLLNSYFCG